MRKQGRKGNKLGFPSAPSYRHCCILFASSRSLSFVVLDPLRFDYYVEASRLKALLDLDSLPSPDRLCLALLDSW